MYLICRNAFSFSTLITVASMMAVVSGCQSSADANRVDPTLARSTLESVLDSWKRGESIDSWQTKDSHIVVQDLEWKAGVKLAWFEILDQGDAVDANLFCRVKLSLVDPNSKRFERSVTYVVGTTPVRTVFRSLMP